MRSRPLRERWGAERGAGPRAVLAPGLLAAAASILMLASSCSSLGGGAANRPQGGDEVTVVASVIEVNLHEDLVEPGSDPAPVPPFRTSARLNVLAPERLAGTEITVHFDTTWPRLGERELVIGDRLTFVLPGDWTERDLWSGELDGLELLPRESAATDETVPAAEASAGPVLRFVGLERLYFERLGDPVAAGDGVAPYLAGELRRLLPRALPDGAGPEPEPRVVTELDGPVHSGLELRDFPLPGPPSGSGSFLRQVIDGTRPRLHDQYWAIYAGGVRTDLWFFATYDVDRLEDPLGGVKVLAPLGVEEILPQPDGGLVLRVSGSVSRPMGAGWLYGTDLMFTPAGGELRYRNAVRRYSFDLGYDPGEERHGRVAVEELRFAASGEPMRLRRAYDGVLFPERSAECGFDVTEHDFPPQGTFEELAEVATCIAAWPETETVRWSPDAPSFLERGWRPEDPEPRGERVTALVVRIELQAHQEWLENGSVILSDVVTLAPVEPAGLGGEIAVLCEVHPHLAGRPVEPGDRLTFVLPPEWPSYDVWFDRLDDLAFASESDAGRPAGP